MKYRTILSSKQRLFVVSNLVLGTVLLSSAALSPTLARRQKEISLPVVKDKTRSFSLISLDRIDGRFVAQVQNISNKTITAYVTAVCDVPESATDCAIGDDLIDPGKVVEITVPIRAVSDMCVSEVTKPIITIVAVVFEDGTYEGELAKGILDDRRGDKIQLKRINRLLAKALEWPDAGEPSAIEKLKIEIAALPVDEWEAPAVRGGMSIAKQRALYVLDELLQWHGKSVTTQSRVIVPTRGELSGIKNLREGIDGLIRLHEKWISRY